MRKLRSEFRRGPRRLDEKGFGVLSRFPRIVFQKRSDGSRIGGSDAAMFAGTRPSFRRVDARRMKAARAKILDNARVDRTLIKAEMERFASVRLRKSERKLARTLASLVRAGAKFEFLGAPAEADVDAMEARMAAAQEAVRAG